MTRYEIKMTLVCPSNWTPKEVIEYLERIAPTNEEKGSIEVAGPIQPVYSLEDGPPLCPICDQTEARGHAPDCPNAL